MTTADRQARLVRMAKDKNAKHLPKCKPYVRHARHMSRHAAGAAPWTVPQLCSAYHWPTGLVGGGTIAIIELGGGWVKSDMEAYFKSISQPMPSIVDISVDGTQNMPDPDPNGADGEVALDIQVSAAAYYVATGKPASVRVYWAQDIAMGVLAAAKDGCDVCSISWGAAEREWGKAAAIDMNNAAQKALSVGMIVLAASGDNDSGDGDSGQNVDLPAAAPYVIGCGGTRKLRDAESVWNHEPGDSSGEGTGGGYSTVFPLPSWQSGLVPTPPAGGGRCVPDIAANADPDTGYRVYFHGAESVVGGTSAVAPLYAGLFAALGRHLGKDLPQTLWKNASAFVDIVSGDNGAYKARTGPDACTGMGVPNGTALKSLIAPSLNVPNPIANPPTSAPVNAPVPPAPAPAPAPAPKPTPTPAPPPAPPTSAPVAPAPAPSKGVVTLSDALDAVTRAMNGASHSLSRRHATKLACDALRNLWGWADGVAHFYAKPGETVSVEPPKK